MKKLLLIFLSILSLSAFAQQKKVAVYVIGEDPGINKVLGSRLVSAIAQSEEFSSIERTESFLAELSKEQKYQRTGAVDDDEISRLGKQFGVQYVCVATVSDAFNEKYLSARLVDVETAQVERTASSSGTIQSLEGIISVANSISHELLSSLVNGRQSTSPKVAVYVVRNEAGKDIGRVLGDKLVAGFTNSGRYIAIERTNSFLSQLSKEQKYQRTGAVDDDEISRLGKQFGVKYVCVADVSDVFGEKFVSARLIDVETAEVVNTHDVGGTMKTMSGCLQVANEIAANLSKGTFKEQKEEKEAKKQARINLPWYELFKTRIKKASYDDGDIWYIGAIDDDGFAGYGLCFWLKENNIYLGNFYKGTCEGNGTYILSEDITLSTCPEGKVYVGEWKNFKYHGTGTVYDKNNDVIYYGKFFWDKPTGKYPSQESFPEYKFGIQNYLNGDKYVGELKNGRPHGKGMYIWAEGKNILWYGEWTDGSRDGYGINIYGDGSKFTTGRWQGDTKL